LEVEDEVLGVRARAQDAGFIHSGVGRDERSFGWSDSAKGKFVKSGKRASFIAKPSLKSPHEVRSYHPY
jgi:hypothetical protein